MMVFPRETPLLRRRAVLLALHAPATLLSVGGARRDGAEGRSGGPASITTQLSLVLVLCYFSLALLAM